ncbi:MAG: 1-acyl-sn-glycerol-3-phosphate acyltransferase [Oscillospiraceae bacterium]|nr:1-acyl-sn-glycerol-3-phosphate acyltransferase [Oscillospiraceae bacterium]
MVIKIGNFFYNFLRYFVRLYFWFKFKVTLYNKEKLPHKLPNLRLTGGYIVACNHQRYIDPPAIAAFVKGRFSFMAKDELFRKNRFFARLIRMCGAFPVVRGAGDKSVIDDSVEYLKKGRVLVIFPEGTRSKDGTIGRAKSGAALIAATAGVPVLPVCIMYGLGGNKKNLDFAVGDVILPDEINITDDSDRKELRRVSERIINSIKELQAQILTARE